MELEHKFKIYYLMAIFSLIFAVVGFSYNAWRLENTEDNNNIRTAAFEVLKELAGLQQIIYSAHYDQDVAEGSPRKGWVKIGLITDLSTLISDPVALKANNLQTTWAAHWQAVQNDRDITDKLIVEIDAVRVEIKKVLKELK